MKGFDHYKTQILKWTCIGLLIRFILMPITMTSVDLAFINYFPMMCAKSGICDPYGYIARDFHHFVWTYYGPFLFYIMSLIHFIYIKLLNPVGLIKMLQLASTMIFVEPFGVRDFIPYMQTYTQLGLFKNLFLMKAPYLLFDFSIAFILLKLASSSRLALQSYKLWMFNIVVLHSQYMIGQCDIMVAFFVTLALFAAIKKKPYLCIASLVAGGGIKLFPFVLIFPTCLLLEDNWKKRFSLLFFGAVLFFMLYLPFYFSSGMRIFSTLKDVRYYPGMAQWILMPVCMVFYVIMSFNALKDSKELEPERKLLFYFLAIGFLVFAASPISLRYFVYITPLLALLLPRYKKFFLFTVLLIFMLAFLRVNDRPSQLGLFIPLNFEYFMSLPSFQEIIGRFINIQIGYKIMSRVLLLSFFSAAWWVWRIKLNEGKMLENKDISKH